MVDWLTWPADLLLNVAGFVASWFIAKDAPSFIVVQMMVATLVLAAIVFLIAFLQALWSSRKQRANKRSS